jgi:hypothetical protein
MPGTHIKIEVVGIFALFFISAFIGTGFSMDPSVFLNILDVDVTNLKSESGDFVQVRKILGEVKRSDTGDAAEYEGRVEYILNDRSQYIAFKIGECSDGYVVEKVDGKVRRFNLTVLNASIKTVSTGGLSLGMDKRDVEKLFMGDIAGGWKLEEDTKQLDAHSFGYKKTVVEKNGDKFCNHLRIILTFDSHGKLYKYDVTSNGCDDRACEED